MSFPLRSSVLSPSSLPGSAGSGICFTQTTTFMGGMVACPRRALANRGAHSVRRVMKVLLLVNSSASSVTARSRVVIQKALSADHEVTLAETSRRGHATRLAQGAASSGTEVVVVLGGDGTLNEAANGLARTSCALAAAARRLDQRVRPHDRAARTTRSRPPATCSTPSATTASSGSGSASVNGRYFLFHVGMGFDAAVVAQVERRAGLKRYAGHPLFVYAGFDTWIRHYDRSRPRFSVRFADGTVVDDGYLSICLNTNPYTYLGNRPLNLAPEATLDRGLAMVTLRTLGVRQDDAHHRLGARQREAPPHVALDRPPRRPHPGHGHRLRPVPVPGRRRPPRRHRAPRDPPRARRPRPRDARAPRRRGVRRSGRRSRTRAQRPRASRAMSGALVIDGVDAEVGEPADALGLVAGPGVDRQAGVVGDAHEVLVHERVVGVDGHVAALGGLADQLVRVLDEAEQPAGGELGRQLVDAVDGGQVEARHEGPAVVELAPARGAGRRRRSATARWGRSPGRRASS